jgi:hypothetical protein
MSVSPKPDESQKSAPLGQQPTNTESGLSLLATPGRAWAIGAEMVAGAITSFAIAWGIGYALTLSYAFRGILGAILATAVNTLSLSRMLKR